MRAGSAATLLGLNVLHLNGEPAGIDPTPAGVRVEFRGPTGRHLLLIGAGSTARGGTVADDLTAWDADRNLFVESASAAWRQRWAGAAPNVKYHEGGHPLAPLWLYYLLCSFAADPHPPAPPHGWTGNGRPEPSAPRDVAAVVRALLKFGHVDVAKGLVEFYRAHPASGTTGGPAGAGYVAMMARDVVAALGSDPAWTREVAWPLIHQAARGFAAVLKVGGGGGAWSLADANLAPLARECLQAAVALAGELGEGGQEYANYRGVLSDGIAGPTTADEPEPSIDGPCDTEGLQFYGPDADGAPFHLATHARLLQLVGVTTDTLPR